MKKLLVSVLFLSLGANAQTTKGEITLSSAIEVSPRSTITAYDIVETRNTSDETMSDLKAIRIADADTKIVTKSELVRKFRELDAKFRLPNEIKILRSQSNISRLEVERKIKNHLLTKCGSCEYTLQINSVPQNLGTDWELDTNVDFNKSTVMIPVYSLSNPSNKGWVVVEIKKYAIMPVLNRALRIGDAITEDSLNMERRLVNAHQDFVNDPKNLIGMQATKFLSAGQIVTARDVKREQILKKGQMVKALFGQNSMEISITAQVEEGGAVGDVIRVRNIDSQKMFAAKIVDRGVVRIE